MIEMDTGGETDPAPPADAAEAMARLKGLFADCETQARFFFSLAVLPALDFNRRCAYGGLAGRLCRTAANIAGRLDRAERVTLKPGRPRGATARKAKAR